MVADWLAGWLAHPLAGWLAGIGWQAGWLAGWLVDVWGRALVKEHEVAYGSMCEDASEAKNTRWRTIP